MRGFKKTLFLFSVLVFLIAYYIYEIKTSPKREKEKSESKRLFSFEKEKLKSIYIKNGEKELEIINEGGNWIIKDKNYECDGDEIKNLINKISSLEFEREIENAENLAQYGLQSPDKIIRIEQDGEKHILYIGDESPSGSYLYTTKDKINIFLVYKWDLNDILGKEIFDLRDKRIIGADIVKSDIDEIEIKKNKNIFLLRRKGDIWYIEKPIEDYASKEKVEKIIDNIVEEKIKKFEEEKGNYGLEKPQNFLRLKVKNDEFFLYIGEKKENLYYAKNSKKPYIFLIDEKIVNDIPEKTDDLRERKLFDFNVSDVSEIEITKRSEVLKFLKEKDRYFLEKERDKKISKDKIEEFLYDIKNIEIDKFLDYSENKLKEFELLPPLIKISVFDGKRKNEIYFGKKTEKEIYCFHPVRKIIFTIPPSDYEKINRDKEFFIEKGKNK